MRHPKRPLRGWMLRMSWCYARWSTRLVFSYSVQRNGPKTSLLVGDLSRHTFTLTPVSPANLAERPKCCLKAGSKIGQILSNSTFDDFDAFRSCHENRQSGFATNTNSSRLQWGTVPHQDPTKSSAVANRNCRVRTPLRAGLQALAAIKSQG